MRYSTAKLNVNLESKRLSSRVRAGRITPGIRRKIIMSQHLQRAKFSFKSVAIIGIAFIVASITFVAPARAQQRALTSDDYARAEKFMGYNTSPLVLHSGVRPNWLPDDRFTYRVSTAEGSEFLIVDPAKAT